jgi:hypothetical protein
VISFQKGKQIQEFCHLIEHIEFLFLTQNWKKNKNTINLSNMRNFEFETLFEIKEFKKKIIDHTC